MIAQIVFVSVITIFYFLIMGCVVLKSVIIAFPNKNTALQIRAVLEEYGIYVSHICATGASVLSIASEMNGGVIVCAAILRDSSAQFLSERLGAGFDIVALSKGGKQNYLGNFISLPMPLDKDEFCSTVAVLVSSRSSFSNRKKADDDYISNAKAILMNINEMTEMQAHKYLQKKSMQQGRKIADVAKDIIKRVEDQI